MQTLLDKLQQKKNLTRGEMQALMTEIMSGRSAENDIRDFLVFMNAKGPTVEEITGAAQIMHKFVLPVESDSSIVLDTCGTGGDGKHTFNISTLAAIVVAACGVTVAKHGNRSVSSRCGSVDVLEALGLNLALTQARLQGCLKEVGIAFLFAQNHHPAMRYVAPVRKSLGVKTIFNVLGPLTNPARATHQMMGVYSKHLADQVVNVLKNLGAKRAVVVHGEDGLDEMTTVTETHVSEYDGHQVTSYNVRPEDFGIVRAREEDLKGGDVEQNAAIAMDVLRGSEGRKLDVVLLNAAFALYAAEKVPTAREGVDMAREAVKSGKAMAKFEQLKEYTHRG